MENANYANSAKSSDEFQTKQASIFDVSPSSSSVRSKVNQMAQTTKGSNGDPAALPSTPVKVVQPQKPIGPVSK